MTRFVNICVKILSCISTATNERSQTFFIYIMRSVYMNSLIAGIFLMAIGQFDSHIEVIKKFDTYLFFYN